MFREPGRAKGQRSRFFVLTEKTPGPGDEIGGNDGWNRARAECLTAVEGKVVCRNVVRSVTVIKSYLEAKYIRNYVLKLKQQFLITQRK